MIFYPFFHSLYFIISFNIINQHKFYYIITFEWIKFLINSTVVTCTMNFFSSKSFREQKNQHECWFHDFICTLFCIFLTIVKLKSPYKTSYLPQHCLYFLPLPQGFLLCTILLHFRVFYPLILHLNALCYTWLHSAFISESI